MKTIKFCYGIFIIFLFLYSCKKDENSDGDNSGKLQLAYVKIGQTSLAINGNNKDIPIDKSIIISFNSGIDTNTVKQNIILKNSDSIQVSCVVTYTNSFNTIVINPSIQLSNATNYSLQINSGLKGIQGEEFPKIVYNFTTINGKLIIETITLNGKQFLSPTMLQNIDFKKINIEISFSQSLDASNYQSYFSFSGNSGISFLLSDNNKKVSLTNVQNLIGLKLYNFIISNSLTSKNGFVFDGFTNSFYTAVDSTPKFPLISDDELLTLVQKQTFKYFWDFAHTSCGMARERNTSGDIVATGGSGFGVMAIIVGIERGFITRNEGLTRLNKILGFLETCDRFHGAWPHWMNGVTGKVNPFGQNDNGADLVETTYMVQGLLTMRQYLNSTVTEEKSLVDRINTLCNGIEYDWFTRGGQNVLYWNWSPSAGWAVNVPVVGYNETLITYIIAGTSVNHPISSDVYKSGYARNGGIVNGNTYYGYKLPLGESYGGPLFFTQYSYLGLDPRNLKDQYANYWQQNVNQSLINWSYCVANPRNYAGYGASSWGLTASDNQSGYSAQSPTNDLGVITPTAAISSIAYTPIQSMNAIKYFYYTVGDKLWGEYGFYDAYNVTSQWWASSYLAIDEGPIIVMIENYRTQLLWNLFMSCPEVKSSLDKLGFTY